MANQSQNHPGNGRSGTHNRGFASMSETDQREIARMGGAAVSENREHMAAIGRKGGEASAEVRAANRRAAKAKADQAQSPTVGTSTPATRQIVEKAGQSSNRTSDSAAAVDQRPDLR